MNGDYRAQVASRTGEAAGFVGPQGRDETQPWRCWKDKLRPVSSTKLTRYPLSSPTGGRSFPLLAAVPDVEPFSIQRFRQVADRERMPPTMPYGESPPLQLTRRPSRKRAHQENFSGEEDPGDRDENDELVEVVYDMGALRLPPVVSRTVTAAAGVVDRLRPC